MWIPDGVGRLVRVGPWSVVVVAAGVLVRDGRLLLGRRRDPSPHSEAWELPGGKTRPGESLVACLERELDEELGIRARAGEPLCVARVRDGDREIVIHALRVVSFAGEPVARVHAELSWADPADWRHYRLLAADGQLLACLSRDWPGLLARSAHGS